MKHFHALTLCGLCLLAGCSKNNTDNPTPEPGDPRTITITAAVSIDTPTGAAWAGAEGFSWDTDDATRLGVCDDRQGNTASASVTVSPDKTAMFRTTVPANIARIWPYYPYSAGTDTESGKSTVNFSVEAEQTQPRAGSPDYRAAGFFLVGNAPAEADETVSSTLQCINALLRFAIYTSNEAKRDDAVRSVSLTATATTDGSRLNGGISSSLNWTTKEIATVRSKEGSLSTTVTLGTPYALDGIPDAEAAVGIYIGALPCTVNGYVCKVITENGTYTFTSTASLTLTAGSVHNLVLDLAEAEFQSNTPEPAERVVFLAKGGTGNGSSDTAPVGTLTAAYQALGDDGGTIVVCGEFELTANFVEPAHSRPVTVTQSWKDKDYRNGTENAFYVNGTGRRYVMNGPVTFENINFRGSGSSKDFILFIANYNPIRMGTGIASYGFTFASLATSTSILGGYQAGQGTPVATDLDSDITVESGKFLLVGFNRSIAQTYTGTAHIHISGGEITNIFGGTASGTGGSVDLNISGGKFVGSVYAGTHGGNVVSGTVNVTISGGDFSDCAAFTGETGQTSKADIRSLAANDELFALTKLHSFKEIASDYLVPDHAFSRESFTDSQGTVLPYRLYLPENYDPLKKYPSVLFIHGLGARGNDNVKQLDTMGAALLYYILNSSTDCIIVAPQCPEGSQWVASYPGDAGYTPESVPMTAHLSAAKELLDHIVSTRPIDTDKLYVCGSSNGAGAAWDLICRYPSLFAAAIPVAGLRDGSNASAIASQYTGTLIWTFHGTADETLSIEGTRKMVQAIRDAGGQAVTYTEVEGADHNTIWSKAAATPGLVEWMFNQ